LITLNISALSTLPYFDASQNKLNNIIWAPQINSWWGISLISNTLPSSEINEILALIVAAGSHYNDDPLQLQTQTPPAPPTGQGITDKATILGSGGGSYVYVTTDN
jgi:hypothetical protein